MLTASAFTATASLSITAIRLQTLYGHMSQIDVKVGDMVRKEQHIGVSGATGMAFGDHVHFSMLIAGVPGEPDRVVGRALDQGPHPEQDRQRGRAGRRPGRRAASRPCRSQKTSQALVLSYPLGCGNTRGLKRLRSGAKYHLGIAFSYR